MWDQVYTPVAGSLGAVRAGRGIAHRGHAVFSGRAAVGRLEVRPARPRNGHRGRGHGIWNAAAATGERHPLRRRIRPVPDCLDRVLGGGAVPPDGRNGAVRDHQELGRPSHPGPPPAGAFHCVRLWGLRRGGVGFRHPGRGGFRHARGTRVSPRSMRRGSACWRTPPRSLLVQSALRSLPWPVSRVCPWQP